MLLLLMVGTAGAQTPSAPPGAEEATAADGSAPQAAGSDEDPERLWSLASQETLPAWSARRERAQARTEAGRNYFAGETALTAAFPELEGAPLDLVSWLDGQLAELNDREQERVLTRAEPVPDLGDEERQRLWAESRDSTLDAEDLAAGQRRRLLLGLRGLAASHPALAGRQFGAERDRLLEALRDLDVQIAAARQAEAAAPAGTDPGPDRGRLERAMSATQLRLRRLEAQADRARRTVTVPGSPGPLDAEDLTRLTQPEAWDAAADRLRRVRGFLTGAERVGVDAALERWETEVEAPRLAAERARRESEAQAAADEAAERAQSARKDADRAAQEANDDDGRRVARILDEVANSEAMAQDGWAATRALETTHQEEVASWEDRLGVQEAEILALREMPQGLGSDRRLRASDAWRQLEGGISELRRAALDVGDELSGTKAAAETARSAALEERARVLEARAWGRELPESPDRDALMEAINRWELSLDERQKAFGQRVDVASHHHDQTFVTLRRAKDLRERLRPFVPGAVRSETRNLVRDLTLEARLLGPNVSALVRRRGHALAALPLLLSDPGQLWAVLVGSFWFLMGLVLWFVLRSRAPALVEPVVLRLGQQRNRLFVRDLRALVAPASAVVVSGIDLVAWSLALGPVRLRAPELAIVVVVLRLVALFRFVDNLFRLAVAPASENRPALVAFRREAWPLVARAQRLLLLWWLLGTLVQYLIRDLIGAEALSLLIGRLFLLAFAGLGLFLLHLAEPQVRLAVMREVPDGGLKEQLSRSDASFLTRAPRALVGIVWYLGLRGWQLLQGNVGENSMLGTLLNLVNRRRLSQRGDDERVLDIPELPNELRRALEEPLSPDSMPSLYAAVLKRADQVLDEWKADQGRGMALLIGDRGQGKRAFIKHWAQAAAESRELAYSHCELNRRLVEPEKLTEFLARELKLGEFSDEKSLAVALRTLPPTLFVIEQVEFGFLRRVGGFAGLRAVFRVLGGLCERHFWLLSAHAPAWRLLERVGTVVSVNTFRAVLELPRLGGAEMQALLLGRAAEQGLAVDFGPLSSSTAAGQPAAERERTSEAYFRLLAEAAGGNPGVAIPLWRSSLAPGAKPDAPLRVRLPDAIASPSLPPLSDSALLTLAAVRVHGGLSADELVSTNNMEQDLVQSTVQVLSNLDLLERYAGRRYRVEMSVLAAVTRMLRRRHFVYGKD